MKRTFAIVAIVAATHATGGEDDVITVPDGTKGIQFTCVRGTVGCKASYSCEAITTGEDQRGASSGRIKPSNTIRVAPHPAVGKDCKLRIVRGRGELVVLRSLPSDPRVPRGTQRPENDERVAADRVIYVSASRSDVRRRAWDGDAYAQDSTPTLTHGHSGEIALFTTEETGLDNTARDDTFHTGRLAFACGSENPREVEVSMSFTKDTVEGDEDFGAGEGVWWLEWGGKVRQGEVRLSGGTVQFPRSACAVEFLDWFRGGRDYRSGSKLKDVEITAYNKTLREGVTHSDRPGTSESIVFPCRNDDGTPNNKVVCEHWFMHGARVREDDDGFEDAHELFGKALDQCIERFDEAVEDWDQDGEECDPDTRPEPPETSSMSTPRTRAGDTSTYHPRRNR